MNDMVESYPLRWPDGIPRNKKPIRSRFDTRPHDAISNLMYQLRLLGARNVVISSNIKTYRRGDFDIPYADQRVDDTGVAVYFDYTGIQHCIPCDKWNVVYDNIHAIGKTVESMRGIERWGTFEMMKATFRGFERLPPSSGEVYGVEENITDYFSDCTDLKSLKSRYRELAKVFHPDKNGSNFDMSEISKQYNAKKEAMINYNIK